MQHLALIGSGAIAQALLEALVAHEGGAPAQLTVLARPGRETDLQLVLEELCDEKIRSIRVTTDIADLLNAGPDLVVECAGRAAVEEHALEVIKRGVDLVVASTSALADDDLFQGLLSAAKNSGAQFIVPSGAIGGIDALAAAKLSDLREVTYTGRKPPTAWKGTPAEVSIDLDNLTEPATFFEGSAREAATSYPKNANVAATLALAGLGVDATRVKLVADPAAQANTHEFVVRSSSVDYSICLAGKASPLNPKTSQSTALSLARTVLNRSGAIVF